MANAYPSHQYSSTDLGLKTVTVSGTFTGWGGFNKEWSSNCIISVESWQDTGTTDLSYGFAQAENLRRIAEIPSGVTTMSNMLKFTSSFIGDINNWDTSKVTDMSRLFWGSNFNGSLNRWDTSSVINMNGTFGFKNDSSLIDVANWNTANVQDMISTFTHSNFNGDISGWNTSKVMDMSYMFYGSSFNQDISSWSVPIVTLHEDFATNLASNYYPNFIN
jgi:surface protein